ncbi:hypothetical protein GE09DRAFT_1119626 [Coniochaeta sp. 2T2.1]|nr:hypothetical protein GE09DRAFT_1119626 [Coniochaeta sp. 2T2.1]
MLILLCLILVTEFMLDPLPTARSSLFWSQATPFSQYHLCGVLFPTANFSTGDFTPSHRRLHRYLPTEKQSKATLEQLRMSKAGLSQPYRVVDFPGLESSKPIPTSSRFFFLGAPKRAKCRSNGSAPAYVGDSAGGGQTCTESESERTVGPTVLPHSLVTTAW